MTQRVRSKCPTHNSFHSQQATSNRIARIAPTDRGNLRYGIVRQFDSRSIAGERMDAPGWMRNPDSLFQYNPSSQSNASSRQFEEECGIEHSLIRAIRRIRTGSKRVGGRSTEASYGRSCTDFEASRYGSKKRCRRVRMGRKSMSFR